MNSFCSGVSMPPGATQFARMPRLMYSSASTFVRWTTPAFDAQYAARVRLGLDPRVRRDVHDRATAVEQVRERRLAHEEGAGEVHADDALPVLERHLVGVREPADARAVHDDRRSAEVLGGRRRPRRATRPGRRRRSRRRGPRRRAPRSRPRSSPPRRPAMSRQPTAAPFGREPQRGRVAEPGTGAGDHRHPTIESTHEHEPPRQRRTPESNAASDRDSSLRPSCACDDVEKCGRAAAWG